MPLIQEIYSTEDSSPSGPVKTGKSGWGKPGWLAALGGVLAAVIVAYLITWQIDPDLIFTLGAPRGAATAPVNGYGFATSLIGLPASQLNQRLDAMKATGVTWVRYDVSWATVQPQNAHQFDWSAYDTITKAAVAHGFHVLMIVDFAPTWAEAKGCQTDAICAPASPIQYGTFAGQVAAHFKSYGVTDFEIWNEPNIAYRFEPSANPKLYVRMLKDAYAAIKRVESNAVIITGGTSPSATDATDYSPADFIKALYHDGAKGWFDAVGAHPYTYPITPSQAQSVDAWGQLATVHTIMAAHGNGNLQIWVTEYGAPTAGPDSVSEAVQAQSATQAISEFRNESWAGPFFWYDFMDEGTNNSTNQDSFGLVELNGSQKPAYAAFVSAISAE